MVKEHDQLQKTLQSMGDLSAQFSESKRTAKELDQQLSAATLENKELHCQLETACLLYTSPSPRDATLSRMPSSA